MGLDNKELDYLRLLAQRYPTIQAASTEIVNLTANLQLPKGTEHFLSDIHGEYEASLHVLKSGSGAIRRKIGYVFGASLPEQEKRDLATLIYYPEERLPLMLKQVHDEEGWYRETLLQLIQLCREVASKYPRAAVRAALPVEFAFIIEELLHEQEGVENKSEYYQTILDTIISIGNAQAFVVALSELVQRLTIAHLHIIGDVYDRGPGAHIIMDTLTEYHSVDFQWGNHDIVWMGAAAGSEACMANVIRVGLRYGNMETLENGYAISILPLASLAIDTYGEDLCQLFLPKATDGEEYTENEQRLMARMHKAITVIQLKVEGQIIRRHPEYDMEERLLLDKIDHQQGAVRIDGLDYPLLDAHFPTIDPADPYQLTEGEQYVVERLKLSFINSEKLQKHMRFMLSKGSVYLIHNGNLLYHGCIPMKADGSFSGFQENGQGLAGRAFMDRLDRQVRQGYFADDPEQKLVGLDTMWYLWSGEQSPLFGKQKMATFERYFIADPATHKEKKNPYYKFRDREETAIRILEEFGLDPNTAHIVNGHVPVKVQKGENPAKAGGSLLVIDGGFSKAYQAKTGIAGYTLIFNSHGLLLAAHEPFESTQRAIEKSQDIRSRTEILETSRQRILVKDTDQGREMQRQIENLKALLQAYRTGELHEQ
jgi:fructose-1,6-bisphosphatase-3